MYEFKHEQERKEKIVKGYIYLYFFIFLATFLYTLFTKDISIQDIAGFLFQLFIFFLALKRKTWGIFMIKLFVWMNIIILFIMIASFIFNR